MKDITNMVNYLCPSVYLDANFFVFALLDTTSKGERAREIQADILQGKQAFTSALALDEVMWVLRKNNKAHLIRKTIEEIYASPCIEIHAVSALIPLQALDLMERFSLKPRDAFHVAVMRELHVNRIVSDDADFDCVAGVERVQL